MLDRHIAQWLNDGVGYWAIQALPGVGPVLAAIFVAEIGDVSRFARPEQLCSWAGLTPKHRESDETTDRGKVTKQGWLARAPRGMCWALARATDVTRQSYDATTTTQEICAEVLGFFAKGSPGSPQRRFRFYVAENVQAGFGKKGPRHGLPRDIETLLDLSLTETRKEFPDFVPTAA